MIVKIILLQLENLCNHICIVKLIMKKGLFQYSPIRDSLESLKDNIIFYDYETILTPTLSSNKLSFVLNISELVSNQSSVSNFAIDKTLFSSCIFSILSILLYQYYFLKNYIGTIFSIIYF
jgi:hypothetical protein